MQIRHGSGGAFLNKHFKHCCLEQRHLADSHNPVCHIADGCVTVSGWHVDGKWTAFYSKKNVKFCINGNLVVYNALYRFHAPKPLQN